MTAIAPAPTPQPHTGDIPPGAHPPTSADILRAAGDMGIGTSAATSFAASLQGLAGQARSKGQELAANLEQHAASIQTMLHKAHGMRAEHWKSSAGRAYRNALEQHEKSLTETHQQVRGLGIPSKHYFRCRRRIRRNAQRPAEHHRRCPRQPEPRRHHQILRRAERSACLRSVTQLFASSHRALTELGHSLIAR